MKTEFKHHQRQRSKFIKGVRVRAERNAAVRAVKVREGFSIVIINIIITIIIIITMSKLPLWFC